MYTEERYIFFFKQKTAYEMRISDWSADVCSSDLSGQGRSGGSQQPDRTNSRKTNRHLARKRTVGKAFFRDCRRDGEEADRPLAEAFTCPACCGFQPGCVPDRKSVV